MSGRKVVSVGICVRNEERFVGDAIDSVLAQDFPHELMEIVVVDDGSEDNTLDVVKAHVSKADIEAKIIHTEWRGLGPARHRVVENAKGKYVLFVDGDTQLSKNYVRRQVEVMERYGNVGIASGVFGICPDDNWVAILENIGYVISRLRQRGRVTSSLLSTAGAILRVDAVKQVGGFDRNIRGAQEDIDLAYRMKKHGWLFYVTDSTFYHRYRRTWKALWNQHFWYGYGLHFIMHKNKGQNPLINRSVDRIPFSFYAYKLTHRKIVFLLPVNFVFKKVALLVGFLRASIDGYGHEQESPDR